MYCATDHGEGNLLGCTSGCVMYRFLIESNSTCDEYSCVAQYQADLPEGKAPNQNAVALRPPAIKVTDPSDRLYFFNSRVNTYHARINKDSFINATHPTYIIRSPKDKEPTSKCHRG